MDLGLDGRVAFVTGASRGIGRAAALELAAEGATVVVGYRTNAAAAQAVADEIDTSGERVLIISMDLADDTSLDDAIDAAVNRFGRLDILVNNAGAFPAVGPFGDQLAGELRQALRLNTEGPARLIQRAVPVMRRDGFGRIVNISSVHAEDGAPSVAGHTASKAALHGLTRSLARELGPDGILVNVVMPGLTLTEVVKDRFPSEMIEAAAERNPTRRNSHPKDVARLVAFLSSPANAYVNGALIRHNGGE
jgi:3-oxoacyl-[acyl-carrier protein] reductase